MRAEANTPAAGYDPQGKRSLRLALLLGPGEHYVMQDFSITSGRKVAVFRAGIDFSEGESRFCWTLSGLDRLIDLGLWKREFDRRGNLITKPMSVEAAMRLSVAKAFR